MDCRPARGSFLLMPVLLLLACWFFASGTSLAENLSPGPSAAGLLGNGSYESSHPALTYGGTWTVDDAAPQASGGELRYSSSVGSYVSFEFEGDTLTWWTATGPAEGVAWFYIDGTYMPEVDLYSPGEKQWQVKKAFRVPAGRHEVRIQVSSSRNANSRGYNITVDAFTVEGGPYSGTATPTPTPQLWLDATVDWQRPLDAAASARQLPLSLWVHPAGQASPDHSGYLFTSTRTTDEDGGALFGLDGLSPGDYDLYVRGTYTLGKVKRSVGLAPGVSAVDFGALAEGDTNGDEAIDESDFYFLAQRFGLRRGEVMFDQAADLSGDGLVDVTDISLMAANYGVEGPIEVDLP